MALRLGDTAPDFSLMDPNRQTVSESDTEVHSKDLLRSSKNSQSSYGPAALTANPPPASVRA